MGFIELLTLIFVVCKIAGLVSWSWWLVLLPELIVVGIYLIIGVTALIVSIVQNRNTKRLFKSSMRR
ncbi:hypothetical protein [Bacillus sp. 1P06AnD]|uniref:hypothetical protein n=1 Tax=Bacillus sp. 1P06AnD TaxID=3132208 RepID=UPI0039A03886